MRNAPTSYAEKRLQYRLASSDGEERLFDLSALAAYTSLSIQTLREYVHDPADPLPHYCIRRKLLIRKSDFDRWLTKYKVTEQDLGTMVDEVVTDVLRALD